MDAIFGSGWIYWNMKLTIMDVIYPINLSPRGVSCTWFIVRTSYWICLCRSHWNWILLSAFQIMVFIFVLILGPRYYFRIFSYLVSFLARAAFWICIWRVPFLPVTRWDDKTLKITCCTYWNDYFSSFSHSCFERSMFFIQMWQELVWCTGWVLWLNHGTTVHLFDLSN